MEAIAHGDSRNSKVVGRQLQEIELPPGTTIGAIVRGNDVVIAHDDIVVEPDDHLILFLVDKNLVPEVEKLFQAPFSFFLAMHFRITLKILGLLLMMFSITMLPPIAISLVFDDGAYFAFVDTFGLTLISGFILWLAFFREQADMRIKDGFLITTMFYLMLGAVGALPLMQEAGIGLSWPNAILSLFLVSPPPVPRS